MTRGICKLTGVIGDYVDSHLIPKAFTQSEVKGAPLIQAGSARPVRRWSSWYDRGLVTREGEEILSGYDDWAVKGLRLNKLVWSGWGASASKLEAEDFLSVADTPWGVRKIVGMDTTRLRVFFLSLLWRAAATQRHEFDEVTLSNRPTSKGLGAWCEADKLSRWISTRSNSPSCRRAACSTI